MKKSLKNVVCLMALMAMAAPSFATIVGSAHDFSGAGWNTTTEICNVCHAPHNNKTAIAGAPMWNHEETAATFTLYTSSTFEASDQGQPSGTSKLCLSCHDGTVNLDAFGTETTGTTAITGTANLGTNLSTSHPISFTYDTALATADGELFDPATASSGLGGTIAADMLFSGKLECASCHDVHDDTNGSFLIMSNDGSDLCMTCHDK